MKKDNAIEKVLEKNLHSLPYGFDEKIMKQVHIQEKKKRKKNYLLNLALISCVSVFLLVGTFFLLDIVYSINLLNILSFNLPFAEHRAAFTFYFYIGLLVLALLGIDYSLRRLYRKTQNGH